jgi:polysaccharide chain length determinant protein (PEP-CTERM system associated)
MIHHNEKALRYLRDLWRARWLAVLVAGIGALAGWTVVFLIPNQYEARASVYVNTASSLAPILSGLAVESDLKSHLELVKQLLLSDEVLSTVADDAKLDKPDASDSNRALTLTDLRQRIQVSGGRASQNDLYKITFRDRNRQASLAVVKSVLEHFINRTIRSNRGYSDSAERFLRARKDEYEGRLGTMESNLADFKRKNMGLLPGEGQDYFSRLQHEIDLRKAAKDHRAQLLSQKEQIKKELSGERPVTALPGVEGANVNGDKSSLGGTSIDRRIADAEAKLSQMRLIWTEKHPEVIAQQELIARLKSERTDYLHSLGVGNKAQGPVSIESNPVYTSLRLALSQLDLRIFEANADIASRSSQVEELQRMANMLPKVEADYQQLVRDYTVTKEQYQEVGKRLEKARLSGEAEQSEDVDFRIIEPATADVRPVEPNRILLLPLVGAFAIALGIWVALTKSSLDPVVYSIEDVTPLVKAPVVGSLRYALPELLTARKRRSMWAMVAMVLLFLIGLTLVLGFETARNTGALVTLSVR